MHSYGKLYHISLRCCNTPGELWLWYVIVVIQVRVHCLICTHDNRGHTAPQGMPPGECGHIRQCTSACVAANMLHFGTLKICPNLLLTALPILQNRSAYSDRHNGEFNKHSNITHIYIVSRRAVVSRGQGK